MAKVFLAIVALAVLAVRLVGAVQRVPNYGRLAVSAMVTRRCPPHLADQRISDNTICKTARTTMALPCAQGIPCVEGGGSPVTVE
jgi:hypothetical protein